MANSNQKKVFEYHLTLRGVWGRNRTSEVKSFFVWRTVDKEMDRIKLGLKAAAVLEELKPKQDCYYRLRVTHMHEDSRTYALLTDTHDIESGSSLEIDVGICYLSGMKLYHKDIGFPAWFKKPTGTVRPKYGKHARIAARTDRYGSIRLPTSIDFDEYQVVEIGVEGRHVTKILFRGQLDQERDLCIVLTETGQVKTVWVNLRSDRHRTLDRSKYATP